MTTRLAEAVSPEKALEAFWSSFGLKAFEENSVPTGRAAPDFPYITYELTTDAFGAEIPLSASLWYYSDSLTEINAKTAEISDRIGYGGILLPCDGGRIWIKRGSPFAQSMGDDSDNMIRRKLINISADFLVNPVR